MQNLSDAELILRAQDGEVEAIEQLYDRYELPIYRYIRSRVHATQLAEDLTGDVFLRMVGALPRFRLTGVPFSAWLYRIARNLITDLYRKKGDSMVVPIKFAEEKTVSENNPATVLENQLVLERVQQALENLDKSQQEVIRLRFLAGLPLAEVAETLERSVASVKALQHRGLLALRVALKQESLE